jgi:hypothetical protein
MVCTPDFQGHLIYLAVVAYLGDAQPRFRAFPPDEAGVAVGWSITRQWTCGMESRLSLPLPMLSMISVSGLSRARSRNTLVLDTTRRV